MTIYEERDLGTEKHDPDGDFKVPLKIVLMRESFVLEVPMLDALNYQIMRFSLY